MTSLLAMFSAPGRGCGWELAREGRGPAVDGHGEDVEALEVHAELRQVLRGGRRHGGLGDELAARRRVVEQQVVVRRVVAAVADLREQDVAAGACAGLEVRGRGRGRPHRDVDGVRDDRRRLDGRGRCVRRRAARGRRHDDPHPLLRRLAALADAGDGEVPAGRDASRHRRVGVERQPRVAAQPLELDPAERGRHAPAAQRQAHLRVARAVAGVRHASGERELAPGSPCAAFG